MLRTCLPQGYRPCPSAVLGATTGLYRLLTPHTLLPHSEPSLSETLTLWIHSLAFQGCPFPQLLPQHQAHSKSKAILKLNFYFKELKISLYNFFKKKKIPMILMNSLGKKTQCEEPVLEPGRPVFKSLTGGVDLGKLHCLCASVSPSVKWVVKVGQRACLVPHSSLHFPWYTQQSLHFPASPQSGGCSHDWVLANWTVRGSDIPHFQAWPQSLPQRI